LGSIYHGILRQPAEQSCEKTAIPQSAQFRFLSLLFFLSVLISPISGEAFEEDIENDFQKRLGRTQYSAETIGAKLSHGDAVILAFSPLKSCSDNMQISHHIFEESIKFVKEKKETIRVIIDRYDRVMEDGYREALAEDLTTIETIPIDRWYHQVRAASFRTRLAESRDTYIIFRFNNLSRSFPLHPETTQISANNIVFYYKLENAKRKQFLASPRESLSLFVAV
jgi:hypothetical protein